MNDPAVIISLIAVAISAAALFFSYKSHQREAARSKAEQRPVVRTRHHKGAIEFCSVDGIEPDYWCVYFPQAYIVDFEHREGVGGWYDLDHSRAVLGHPIEHGRWWSLPEVDATGEVTFTLTAVVEGRKWWRRDPVSVQWEITDSVLIPRRGGLGL